MSSADLKLTLHFMDAEPQAAARKIELLPLSQAAWLLQQAPVVAARTTLMTMLPNVAAKILPLLAQEHRFALTEKMDLASLAAILRNMPSDDCEQQLKLLSMRKQTLCKMLISYPEYSVGSMIETDMLMLDSQMQAEDALLRIKNKYPAYLQTLYVVDQQRLLIGQLFMGDLLQAAPSVTIESLMQKPSFCLNASIDILSAYENEGWQQQDVAAVVNRHNEFIGILHFYRLRHFIQRKRLSERSSTSVSGDLLEIYGDTIISMVDLFGPGERHSNIHK